MHDPNDTGAPGDEGSGQRGIHGRNCMTKAIASQPCKGTLTVTLKGFRAFVLAKSNAEDLYQLRLAIEANAQARARILWLPLRGEFMCSQKGLKLLRKLATRLGWAVEGEEVAHHES